MIELSGAIEDNDPQHSYWLDTQTGEVLFVGEWMASEEKEKIYERIDDEDDLDRYVRIPKIESHEAWEEMADFVETIKDSRLHELLSIALVGKGAFRRFRSILHQNPNVSDRWDAFHRERICRQIHSWLEEEGLKP